MTEKQRRFADEYLIDLNATRAYRAAYPSVKRDDSAAACAYKLLRNAQICEYIQEKMQERQEACGVTQKMVIEGIMEIAFNDEEEGKTRLRAFELLGKHIGMFNPRKDKLDLEEQKARIEKLRADTRKENDEDRTVTVRFVDTEEAEE